MKSKKYIKKNKKIWNYKKKVGKKVREESQKKLAIIYVYGDEYVHAKSNFLFDLATESV